MSKRIGTPRLKTTVQSSGGSNFATVHKMHSPKEKLIALNGLGYSWRKIGAMSAYTKPDGTQIHYRTLYRWAVENREPKNAIERCVLGLPALLPAPACAKCGSVHVTKRCTAKKEISYFMASELAEMGIT